MYDVFGDAVEKHPDAAAGAGALMLVGKTRCRPALRCSLGLIWGRGESETTGAAVTVPAAPHSQP